MKYLTIAITTMDGTPTPEQLQRWESHAVAEIYADGFVAFPTIHHVELEDVKNFHSNFLVPMADSPSLLDRQAHDFRLDFLKEEVREFEEGQTIHDKADALVDLVYVALGTALMMGLPWAKLWATVHERNMAKRLAKPDGSDSKRKNPLDVVKPPGWYPPNHSPALGLTPTDPAPVFNATEAISGLSKIRKGGAV